MQMDSRSRNNTFSINAAEEKNPNRTEKINRMEML